jgi:hypothetical protein
MKTLLLACMMLLSVSAYAEDEQQVIRDLMLEFLTNVDEETTHQRFWADDLVYTSSAGSRFGKAQIMAGFGQKDEDTDKSGYSAQDMQIKILGEVAIVTYTLVRHSAEKETMHYLNSTVMAKRQGMWVAVNHQSTIMP